MVYEKKCSECDKIIDFGGEDPGRLPDNAVEFDDKIYCKECVKEFVEFGTGDILGQIQQLSESVEDIREELGMEKTLNS
jgi:hypothetical protein